MLSSEIRLFVCQEGALVHLFICQEGSLDELQSHGVLAKPCIEAGRIVL
jgi:hypothetical protein